MQKQYYVKTDNSTLFIKKCLFGWKVYNSNNYYLGWYWTLKIEMNADSYLASEF